jgi:hypothetical protein
MKPGPPMTLGNMRQLGVQNLIASCLNDACRHQGLIDASNEELAVRAEAAGVDIDKLCRGKGNTDRTQIQKLNMATWHS